MRRLVTLLSIAVLFTAGLAQAAEGSFCEVIKVSGRAQLLRKGQAPAALEQGMQIQKGDTIVTEKDATADLAFDAEWNNVTHLEGGTRVTVRWFDPARLEMKSGDIYAKLEKLPKGSSFEVATPTAIATVRGTRFRTTYENGHTNVFNDSETSLVYIYRVDENGNRSGRMIVLKPGESMEIAGIVQFEELMPEEIQEARDREDQETLKNDLKKDELQGEQQTQGGGGY